MKFSEYTYEHIDADAEKAKISAISDEIKTAETYDAFLEAFKKLDKEKEHLETVRTLVMIRHTIDTRDSEYTDENNHLNRVIPQIQEALVEADEAVLASKFVDQFKKDVPEVFFLQKDFQKRAFDSKIIEDLQKENQLATDYQALVASAEIDFDGKVYSLEGLHDVMYSQDLDVRKRANKAYWAWFEEHSDEIGEIFDKLVHLRDNMAHKLGYNSYVELGYVRMNRFDYDKDDVANYRKQILKDVVPLDDYLYDRQKKRMCIDSITVWDEKMEFASGNPTPKYETEEMKKRALKMYKELDKDTGDFFQFMMDHELMDLDAKCGKAAGGYCDYMPDYESPFIFSNFDHTLGDAEVLTHEAGHAFQAYMSKGLFPVELMHPTYETCEIHSMSMEFFTYPWMSLFFNEDTDKYYFAHLSQTVKFLPYGILVDHFQHEVYANPNMTHKERMACWRKLEKMYLPFKDYSEFEFLEEGGWWMRQLHIFLDPFYYVDYTLAQVCALQFWARIQEGDKKAFDDYKHLCKIGGSLPFRQIVKEGNLKCPFDDGCLTDTMAKVKAWFEKTADPE